MTNPTPTLSPLLPSGKRRGPAPGSAAARRGGDAMRDKYGPDFFRKIGALGGAAIKRQRGAEYYAEIGKKGGARTRDTRERGYYSRIGKKGGECGRGKSGRPARVV